METYLKLEDVHSSQTDSTTEPKSPSYIFDESNVFINKPKAFSCFLNNRLSQENELICFDSHQIKSNYVIPSESVYGVNSLSNFTSFKPYINSNSSNSKKELCFDDVTIDQETPITHRSNKDQTYRSIKSIGNKSLNICDTASEILSNKLEDIKDSYRSVKLLKSIDDLKIYTEKTYKKPNIASIPEEGSTNLNNERPSILIYAANYFFSWLSSTLFDDTKKPQQIKKHEINFHITKKSTPIKKELVFLKKTNPSCKKEVLFKSVPKKFSVAPKQIPKVSSFENRSNKVVTKKHPQIVTSKNPVKQRPFIPKINLAKVEAVKLSMDKENSVLHKHEGLKRENNFKNLSYCGSVAEAAILKKRFSKDYWREEEIKPIKKRLPKSTLWQQIWHLTDPNTKKILMERHYNKINRVGHPVITRQKRNIHLQDSSQWSWNHATSSHVELTLFSVENVPYIAQVIIETDMLRFWVPFNCYFMRIPYSHDDQIIHLWFTSPVGRSQRFSSDPITGSDEGKNDWVGAVDPDQPISTNHKYANCDEDEMTEKQLQMIVEKVIHPRSHAYNNLPNGEYTPSYDFLTYFRFDIPIRALIDSGGSVETVAALDPRSQFYYCNSENNPETNFRLLCQAGQFSEREPLLKFCATLYKQGVAKLVYTEAVNPSSRMNICRYSFKTLYIAQKDDLLDYYVAAQLNENNQELLKAYPNVNIRRIYYGKYFIHGLEVSICTNMISVTLDPFFNFQSYPEIDKLLYAQSFMLPVVCCDNILQPLKNFIMQTRINQKLIDSWSRQRIELVLMNSIQFPFSRPAIALERFPIEFLQNPSSLSVLVLHWQSIVLNIARYLHFGKNCQLPECYLDNLKPVMLNEVLWTFYIDPDSLIVELAPFLEPRLYHDPEFWIPLPPNCSDFNNKTMKFSEFTNSLNNVISSSDVYELDNSTISGYTLTSDSLKAYITSDDFNMNLIMQPKSLFYPDVLANTKNIEKPVANRYDVTGVYIPDTDPFSFKNPELLARLSLSEYKIALENFLTTAVQSDENTKPNNQTNPSISSNSYSEFNNNSQNIFISKPSKLMVTTQENPEIKTNQISPIYNNNNEGSSNKNLTRVPTKRRIYINKSADIRLKSNIAAKSLLCKNKAISKEAGKNCINKKSFCSLTTTESPNISDWRKSDDADTTLINASDSDNVSEQIRTMYQIIPNIKLSQIPSNSAVSNYTEHSGVHNHANISLNYKNAFKNDNFGTSKNTPTDLLSEISSVCSTQRNETPWAKIQIKKKTPNITEYCMCTNMQELQEFRDYIIKEQKINKPVRSRITGRTLGYKYSYFNSDGVLIIPSDPELPPIEILEKMTKQERKDLKENRKLQIIQLIQNYSEQEWKNSETYKKFKENSLISEAAT